jgi:flagellar M-ring protein FliF
MSDIAAPTDVVPAQARTVSAPPSARPLEGARLLFDRMKALGAQPAVARSLPALGAIAALGLAAMIWMAFSAAPSRDLLSGLADQDKAAVVEALDAAGVAYEMDRTTGALSVSGDDYHRARMLLASQGLPKSAPDGNEMIASLPLGASRAVENERLRGAKEVDLARSIEAIDAVQSARVHLALETPSVFVRDRAQRAASVILRLAPGRVLGAEQVQAIVHLVASSVPGLAPEGVSVIDQAGKLLSSGSGDAAGAASERQVAVQAKIEERYRETLTALLTPIVGAGNFTAEVHADLDFSETQATRESFPKEASTLRSEEGSWTAGGSQETTAGIPGALSNQVPTATTVAAAPGGQLDPTLPEAGETAAAASGKSAENYTRNFAIGREVSVSRQAPGALRRLSVAVALKQPEGGTRNRQELAALEALVKGAIGFSQARGDVVALSASNFAPLPESSASAWWNASWVSLLARNLSALAIAALLILGVVRPLMRRSGIGFGIPLPGKLKSQSGGASSEASATAAAADAAGAETAVAAVNDLPEPGAADITLKLIEAAPSYEARAVLIRNFVRQDPDRAALVLRDLLREDKAEGADRNG